MSKQPEHRLSEAVGLIRAVAAQPDCRRVPAAVAENILHIALHLLGCVPGSPQSERAQGDIAAVIAAVLQARRPLNGAAISRVLDGVDGRVGDIDRLLADEAGRAARVLLEEEALRIAAERLVPPRRVSTTPFSDFRRRLVMGDLDHTLRRRRGSAMALEAARRAGMRTAPGRLPLTVAMADGAFLRQDLTEAQKVTEAAATLEKALLAEGGLVGLLYDAVAAVRERLGGARTAVTPPPGLVLVWGCLELYVAHRPVEPPKEHPLRKEPSSHGTGALAKLVEAVGVVAGELADPVEGEEMVGNARNYGQRLRQVVAAWSTGSATAQAFRGERLAPPRPSAATPGGRGRTWTPGDD